MNIDLTVVLYSPNGGAQTYKHVTQLSYKSPLIVFFNEYNEMITSNLQYKVITKDAKGD